MIRGRQVTIGIRFIQEVEEALSMDCAPPPDVIAPLAARAVQGYSADDEPIGKPGDLQGFYHWLGTGQMYSSARDMAVFLAANLGELPEHRALQAAMRAARRGVLAVSHVDDFAPRHIDEQADVVVPPPRRGVVGAGIDGGAARRGERGVGAADGKASARAVRGG